MQGAVFFTELLTRYYNLFAAMCVIVFNIISAYLLHHNNLDIV